MLKKIGMAIFLVLIGFFGYVSTRSGEFSYTRSGVIEASADKIFPYLSTFKLGSEWSPYEKDTSMKKTITGTDSQVGTTMEFESNDSGSGKLEFLKIVPNELVEIKLTMIKPVFGENLVVYKLTPEGTGTKFTWSMSGNGGFISKLMGVLIDCEKMIGGQFEQGIASLKSVVEGQNKVAN